LKRLIGWQPPAEQPGAREKILARLADFRENEWGDRELYQRDPDDQVHGYHGLIYRLLPHYDLGHIGYLGCEFVSPPSGNGLVSVLWSQKYRPHEMLKRFGPLLTYILCEVTL